MLLLVPFTGENSGVVGLSLVRLAGERGPVGLNMGAEGLRLEEGGDNSGVLGLKDELLPAQEVGGVILGAVSILHWFPSIGAPWDFTSSALSASSN